jgi:hypothetical protein
MAALFWEIGTESYQKNVKCICQFQPKSLVLTWELLRELEHLQTIIQGIHQLIQQGIAELDEIEKEEKILN